MGSELLVQTEIEQQAPPTVNIELFTIGQQYLETHGFDPEVARRMATIQMNAGGKCVGTFAEYVAVPDHVQAADRIMNKVKTAVSKGEDAIETVYDRLDAFLERDADDKVVHAVVESSIDGSDPKKKVIIQILNQ